MTTIPIISFAKGNMIVCAPTSETNRQGRPLDGQTKAAPSEREAGAYPQNPLKDLLTHSRAGLTTCWELRLGDEPNAIARRRRSMSKRHAWADWQRVFDGSNRFPRFDTGDQLQLAVSRNRIRSDSPSIIASCSLPLIRSGRSIVTAYQVFSKVTWIRQCELHRLPNRSSRVNAT